MSKKPTAGKAAGGYVALLLLVCMARSAFAETRTWTSASGATLEAEFVRVEGSRVILRTTEEGERLIGIGMASLSAADREHVKKALSSSAESVPASVTQTTAKKGSLFAYEKPPERYPAACPGFAFRYERTAYCLGIQYGPGAEEVLYLGFDPAGDQMAADQLNLYGPASPTYRNGVKLKGKKKRIEGSSAYAFGPVKLSSRFGDIDVSYDLELRCGACNWSLLSHVTEVTLSRGAVRSTFTLGEVLNESASATSDPFKVVPLLGKPHLEFSVGYDGNSGDHKAHVSLLMKNAVLVPGEGMSSAIEVAIMNTDGKTVETEDLQVTSKLLEVCRGKTQFAPHFTKPKPGENYSARGSIDLGPLLGKAERERAFTGK